MQYVNNLDVLEGSNITDVHSIELYYTLGHVYPFRQSGFYERFLE